MPWPAVRRPRHSARRLHASLHCVGRSEVVCGRRDRLDSSSSDVVVDIQACGLALLNGATPTE